MSAYHKPKERHTKSYGITEIQTNTFDTCGSYVHVYRLLSKLL